MNLKEHQAKIQKLPYKTHALRTAAGKRLIAANHVTEPSRLPQIIKAIEDMEPDEYIVRCSNGSKDYYDYTISTLAKPTNAPAINVSTSQASADDLKTAERLGRLESENAYLRQQLAEAGERIQALEAEALEADWDDEADEILSEQAPSPKEKILEAIAPVIPALADRALALVDKFLNKPSAQPLAEAPQQAAPVIDYERLATMVSQKLIESQQYDDEPVS
ncbi:MAG: hypothetical protein EBS17_07695 [Flavobacteriia bacterium]|nr:hypothetical protein [Flavobacteriia bacterium]